MVPSSVFRVLLPTCAECVLFPCDVLKEVVASRSQANLSFATVSAVQADYFAVDTANMQQVSIGV